MNRLKEPLYRKVNTRARGVHHNTGGDARHDRNSKDGVSEKMRKNVNRGLDYTPLYRFLLSKVGQNFDEVCSEALSRLDVSNHNRYANNPIFHIVNREINHGGQNRGFTHCGENSIYSTLLVDDEGNLQYVNPNIRNEHFAPGCPCCTHTFNGKPLIRKYLNGQKTFEMPENVNRV